MFFIHLNFLLSSNLSSKFSKLKAFGNFTEMIENMNINYQYWKDKLPIAEPRSRKVSESADDIKEVDEENNNDMTS